MKKLLFPIILVIILGIAAVILYINNSGSTIKKELRDFAVEDTASVTRIFLADKNNQTITLDRKDGFWTVNKNFIARRDLIDVLLRTICHLNVKAPVPKSAHNTIVKGLAANSTKVEIYQNNALSKTYYVGGATPDNMGTYMLIEGSGVPFVMDLPGFTGYLSLRYTTDISEWKDRCIFRYKFSDIASVTIENPAAPSQSFQAIQKGTNKFSLYSLSEKKELSGFDTLAVKEYMAYFKKMNFETYVTTITKERRDSVFKSRPILIITVEDKAGTKKTIRMYLRPNYDKLMKGESEVYEWDPDRMYAFINDDRDLVIIQYFVFDPVIKELNYFFRKHGHTSAKT
jgi:hypothetical protein